MTRNMWRERAVAFMLKVLANERENAVKTKILTPTMFLCAFLGLCVLGGCDRNKNARNNFV